MSFACYVEVMVNVRTQSKRESLAYVQEEAGYFGGEGNTHQGSYT